MKPAIVVAVFFIFFLLPNGIFASEMMNTADAFDTGQWQVSVYGVDSQSEPKLRNSGAQGITIPLSGGGTSTLFSNSDVETKMEQGHREMVAALTFRPSNGLHYRVKAGQIRNFEIEYSSGSLENSFQGPNSGYVWGAGLRWNATQGTIVSAAVAIDLSYTYRHVSLDRFQSGPTVTPVEYSYQEDEFQAALNVSRRWKKIEPYGGLKVLWIQSKLRDETSKESMGGKSEGVSPFLGLNWEVFEGEFLFIEGSMVQEELISAGVNLRF